LGDHGLAIDGVALDAIASAVGTPTYVYGAAEARRRYRRLAAAFARRHVAPLIAYAVKANDTQKVIATFAGLGAGADTVSEGEIRRALAAGVAPAKIVFSGVAKSDRELRFALDSGVGQINVESREELDQLSAIAASAGRRARVALRVNPDVDARTHAQITTGKRGNKFGLTVEEAMDAADRLLNAPTVALAGLSCHVGSQIFQLDVYRQTFARLAAMIAGLRAKGYDGLTLDIGGGLGIPYAGEPEVDLHGYVDQAVELARSCGVGLILEPGRWLIGPAGVLLARVIREKRQGDHRFVLLDAGMNDLARPAMYGARHAIVPVSAERYRQPAEPADVVGPVCETSDRFGDHLLPAMEPGDLVALLEAGAYGATMSSAYNSRPTAAGVVVDNGCWSLARRRPSYGELIAADPVGPGLTVRDPSQPHQQEVF
jgi:diaminopimelate decarboxylase